jgi:hypothetical protein
MKEVVIRDATIRYSGWRVTKQHITNHEYHNHVLYGVFIT